MRFLNTALIDKGDVAILSRPFYPPYMPYLKIFEGNEIFADYDEDRGWDFDLGVSHVLVMFTTTISIFCIYFLFSVFLYYTKIILKDGSSAPKSTENKNTWRHRESNPGLRRVKAPSYH